MTPTFDSQHWKIEKCPFAASSAVVSNNLLQVLQLVQYCCTSVTLVPPQLLLLPLRFIILESSVRHLRLSHARGNEAREPRASLPCGVVVWQLVQTTSSSTSGVCAPSLEKDDEVF